MGLEPVSAIGTDTTDIAMAVKENDFKKCDQSGFCKRNRAYADRAAANGALWTSPYNILPESAAFENGQFRAIILKTTNNKGDSVRLPITVSFTEAGVARVTIDEERRQNKDIELRHNSAARKERYNEAEQLVIVGGLTLDKTAKVVSEEGDTSTTVQYGLDGQFEASIHFSPFKVDFKRDGATEITFNNRGLFNMEHWRPQGAAAETKEGEAAPAPTAEEDTWWEESFGGNTDSKPRGPESVGLDISFVGYEHVYGIPLHAGPLSLKETRGGDGNYAEPYRMYNLDVFEYILDSPMTLYGSIPFMQAHRQDSTVGVFWLNAAETWVDITKEKIRSNPLALGAGAETDTKTHWISESGLLDVFVFLGPTTQDVLKKYGELTGYTAMPQESAIGYHQCRWNYVSDDDVKDVDRKMDKFNIPYDVIWLDIEYTDGKKYFTWDADKFIDPAGMGKRLDEHGRKLVVIIDPHIKNSDDYAVVSQLKSKEFGVKKKDGGLFDGWCWPGSSHWIDAFNPKAVEWWKTLFKYDAFKGTAENTFIWNDMNEPSVFNGPETTMPKDNLHHGGWEHRDVHNLNGMTFHNATHMALMSRKSGELRRPFVLTRSFFAGSQRLGAMWTGDNQASWDHLAASVPMLLSQGIAGFPFSGADVGGFFGDPDKELQTRWFQAGVFYPFFRGHAHIDSRRREPYLAGEPYTAIITAALRLRYSLLPAYYTAFHRAHVAGEPIIKPMYYTHPNAEGGFAIDDQFFVGNTGLLAKPVQAEGHTSVGMFIPDHEVYYDYFDYSIVPTQPGKRTHMPAPLETIPLLMRGGHIFPRRDQPRRSSQLMKYDDYTLVVTMPRTGSHAEGSLYVDDGDSYDYEQGQYIHQLFVLDGDTISSTRADGSSPPKKAGAWLKAMADVYVDKIVVVGAPSTWAGRISVTATSGGETWTAPLDYTPAIGGRAAFAVVRHLRARAGADWQVSIV
ncbi:glucosidase II [Sporothrix epigloea]|uniref:alpha-glucosidase n=1 Tax=Sporothrix epigloea TaxID=1892477 RepID=A0ABP0DKI4_9PEZI